VSRARSELSEKELELQREKERCHSLEQRLAEIQRRAHAAEEEMMSPRRLEPLRMADERAIAAEAQRDNERLQASEEQRRHHAKVQQLETEMQKQAKDAASREEQLREQVDRLRNEVKAAEARVHNAERAAAAAEAARESAVLEVMASPRRGEVEAEIGARHREIVDLRERLEASERQRHKDSQAHEAAQQGMQQELAEVERTAKDEIRKLDSDLHSAQQAMRAAQDMVMKDADAKVRELEARARAAEQQRDEQHHSLGAEMRSLAEQRQQAQLHAERLSREITAANERAQQQHGADAREVSEIRQRMQALQLEKEAEASGAHGKINELVQTLTLAKEEIRRLDGELHRVRLNGPRTIMGPLP